MTDENKDVQLAEKTAPAPSTENNDQNPDNGVVPRHRLNEAEDKRKAAEAEAAQAKADKAAAEARIVSLQKALGGADTQAERDDLVTSFASKYNVPEDFVSGLLDVASKKLNKQQKPDPVVLEAVAEVKFRKELDALVDDIPEAKELSREDERELKKRAFSKEFLNTPLKSIYRDYMYDKRPTKASFEESRSGGRQVDEAPTDFGKMSPDEMRDWSKKNLGRNKRRR